MALGVRIPIVVVGHGDHRSTGDGDADGRGHRCGLGDLLHGLVDLPEDQLEVVDLFGAGSDVVLAPAQLPGCGWSLRAHRRGSVGYRWSSVAHRRGSVAHRWSSVAHRRVSGGLDFGGIGRANRSGTGVATWAPGAFFDAEPVTRV